MAKLFGLSTLMVLGLMAGGCSHGAGFQAYAGPGYGHHAMVEEGDGDELPPTDEVLPAPMYGYQGYAHHVGFRRGRPHCHPGMHLTYKLNGRPWCVANDGRDVESEEAKEALAGCSGGRIVTRWHWEGTHYVLQKRGVGCHRVEQDQ